MNEQIKKILIMILIISLLVIFVLALLGSTNIINFWIAAILIAVFAFFILPKLNK
ncbi:hypothetical protein KKG83_01715 [Candidatus Micrarchaeota archaeon]|nr:hypothetical protein [Candidatus Micrarchaeota archaeon]MBU2476166.1 hypothetical protein [Candidatus Micrarchaeota archaeon]